MCYTGGVLGSVLHPAGPGCVGGCEAGTKGSPWSQRADRSVLLCIIHHGRLSASNVSALSSALLVLHYKCAFVLSCLVRELMLVHKVLFFKIYLLFMEDCLSFCDLLND